MGVRRWFGYFCVVFLHVVGGEALVRGGEPYGLVSIDQALRDFVGCTVGAGGGRGLAGAVLYDLHDVFLCVV